ncbi:DNA primase [Aerococcus urinaehominis]|uniref:DNA primase n=1 Tax=Aerococcus urinaehominis TaxID=128944 RepID=UPI000884686A|nr:DNA primase [Aerococcus urinaehominis]SDM60282.1 DNA primase [Aerococcus urinaehominis]
MANFIPNEIVNQIKAEADIVDVIGQFVDLEKRGKNHFGYCPFHEENTPSFSVNEEDQFFHCFSCKRGGNVFSFLMDLENYSFPEAVEKTAELAGIQVDFDFASLHQGGQHNQVNAKHQRLYQLHAKLADLYHYLLTATKAGDPGRTYLAERGLDQETIKTYQIGYAPDQSDLIYQQLLADGFTNEEMLAAGVMVGHGDRLQDRFRGRLIFPLRDDQGRVAAFSGRLFQDQLANDEASGSHQAKYLNSPETEIFHKRDFLFNLDLAKQEVRRSGQLVLFEGFMDVIAAHQAGLKNGVASMGTSLTDQHIRILSQQTKQVVIAYDGDRAGLDASQRALDHIRHQAPKLEVSLVVFPQQLDPDDFIQREGADRFRQVFSDQQLTPFNFLRLYYRRKYNLSLEWGKYQYIEALLSEIKQAQDPLKQEIYLQELAQDTDISLETLTKQLQQLDLSQPSPSGSAGQPPATSASPYDQVSLAPAKARSNSLLADYSLVELSELQLFHYLLYDPEAWLQLELKAPVFMMATPLMQRLYILLVAYRDQLADPSLLDAGDFLDHLVNRDEQERLVIAMQIGGPAKLSADLLTDLLYNISTRAQLEARKDELLSQAQEAGLANDFSRQADLYTAYLDVLRQLKKLS